ncbi:hypothetical protein QYF36_000732 [Acer negundo]|nr:hypothetical protein QYF36_000732 [Acer negundo]
MEGPNLKQQLRRFIRYKHDQAESCAFGSGDPQRLKPIINLRFFPNFLSKQTPKKKLENQSPEIVIREEEEEEVEEGDRSGLRRASFAAADGMKRSDRGILDHHFQDVRGLQGPENPRFVSEMITTFINDADVAMATVTRLLMNNSEVLNFDNLFSIVHPLKGSSASIGGRRMALVSHELCLACNERNKERFLENFERLKPEYQSLRESLDYIRQIGEGEVMLERTSKADKIRLA